MPPNPGPGPQPGPGPSPGPGPAPSFASALAGLAGLAKSLAAVVGPSVAAAAALTAIAAAAAGGVAVGAGAATAATAARAAGVASLAALAALAKSLMTVVGPAAAAATALAAIAAVAGGGVAAAAVAAAAAMAALAKVAAGGVAVASGAAGAAMAALAKASSLAHAPVRALAGGLDAVGQVGKSVLGSVSALTGAMQSSVAQYTRMFNPAATKLFELAVNDLNASIGEALMPVLRIGTAAVRSLGDVIAGVSPQAKMLLAALVAAGVGAAVTAAMVTGLSVAFATATGGISIAVGALVGGAAAFLAVSAPIDGVKKLFAEIANKTAGAMNFLGAAAEKLAKLFKPLTDVLLGLMDSGLGEAKTLIDPVVKGLEMLVKSIVPILTDVVPALMMLAGGMNYFNVTILRVLAAVASLVIDGLAPVIAVVSLVVKGIAAAFAVVAGVVNVVMDVFEAVKEAIMKPIRAVRAAVEKVLQPAFDELSAAFKKVREFALDFGATVYEVFGEIVEGIMAFLQPVVDFVQRVLVAAFTYVANAIRAVAKHIGELVDSIREFFGIEKRPPGPDVKGAGDGKAIKNVQQTNVTSFLDKARSASFGAGRGDSDAKKTADATGKATNHLKDISDFMKNKLPQKIVELGDAIVKGFKEKAGEVVKDVQESRGGRVAGVAAKASVAAAIPGVGPVMAIREAMRRQE